MKHIIDGLALDYEIYHEDLPIVRSRLMHLKAIFLIEPQPRTYTTTYVIGYIDHLLAITQSDMNRIVGIEYLPS